MAQYVSIASLIFTLALACAWPCSLAAQPVESEQSMGNKITIRIRDKVFRRHARQTTPQQRPSRSCCPCRSR